MSDGQVTLGLHLHEGLSPERTIAAIRAEARAAEAAGFDGVTLSEHHGGFPGYLPCPTLAASWILAATSRIWSGPCPILLPLRPPRLVAEELAWLNAAFPGRVAAGVAPGYVEADFAVAGADLDDRSARFEAGLHRLTSALRGTDDLVRDDLAIRAQSGAPLAIVSACGSVAAARRSAKFGIGLQLGAFTGAERVTRLLDAYRDGGGVGPIMFIRRVWVGDGAPVESLRAQLDRYKGSASATPWIDGGLTGFAHGPGDAIADSLLADRRIGLPTVWNLRVHTGTVSHDEVLEQIARLGDQVLPRLRSHIS